MKQLTLNNKPNVFVDVYDEDDYLIIEATDRELEIKKTIMFLICFKSMLPEVGDKIMMPSGKAVVEITDLYFHVNENYEFSILHYYVKILD